MVQLRAPRFLNLYFSDASSKKPGSQLAAPARQHRWTPEVKNLDPAVWIQLCGHTPLLPASVTHIFELPLVQEVHPSSHTSTTTQPRHALLQGASKVLQRHCLTLWSPRACTHAHCHICIAQGMGDRSPWPYFSAVSKQG